MTDRKCEGIVSCNLKVDVCENRKNHVWKNTPEGKKCNRCGMEIKVCPSSSYRGSDGSSSEETEHHTKAVGVLD